MSIEYLPDWTGNESNAATQALQPPKAMPDLQPDALAPGTAQAVKDLLQEGESSNTRSSYQSAMRYWGAWYLLRYGQAMRLPLSVAVVLQFIVDHAERQTEAGLTTEMPTQISQALLAAGYKSRPGAPSHNTLVHRIAVLSKAHQVHGLPNPCQQLPVRELLARTRKAYARRGVQPRKKDALTRPLLERLLATCDESLRGKRDRALLLFAWASGGRRRSEVSGADMRFLRQVGAAEEYIYLLAHSKTNQSGADLPENYKPVTGMAAQALRDWLTAAQITEGAIFRGIRKGGHLGEPLSAAAVRKIVLERCALAGVEGNFSAHSLRSGFVTEAGRQNVPLADTMALTGHQSVSTVIGYFRADSSLGNRAARLLDAEVATPGEEAGPA